MLLRDVIGAAGCKRIVYVDPVVGNGRELFEAVQQVGAEGIVSKRQGSLYRGGESRDWLKTKCHAIGSFAITGFSEMGEGRLEAIYVAEVLAGELRPVGQVRFGFAGKGLWPALDALRAGPRQRGGFIPVWLGLMAEIKFRPVLPSSVRRELPLHRGKSITRCTCGREGWMGRHKRVGRHFAQ